MSFRKSNDSNIDLTKDLSAYEGLRDLNKSFRKKKKKKEKLQFDHGSRKRVVKV